jgi:hypothetical protein
MTGDVARIQILRIPGCPNADRARETVARVLRRLGIEAAVEEVVGEYASPTVLVGGRDVTGQPLRRTAAVCRLDLPTEEQVLAALRRADRDEDGGARCDR